MISQLSMCKVASFKDTPAVLDTDKRVNLIYGLNGSGKSTISNYFLDREHANHANCSIKCDGDEEILVYNQKFIEDTFYEAESLKGIFTLSKENKDAQTAISNATKETGRLTTEQQTKQTSISTIEEELAKKVDAAKDKCWEIKTQYAGPERVLDFCLDNLRGSKDALFNHLEGISKPAEKPSKTIKEIEDEIRKISAGSAGRLNSLSELSFSGRTIETDALFEKVIVGSSESAVADVIEKLQNSDWVKQGLKFLPEQIGETNETCPFCQEATISQDFIANIQAYFDESYENDRSAIANHLEAYRTQVDSFPKASEFTSHEMLSDKKAEFEAKYNELISTFAQNIRSIEAKLNTPSEKVTLAATAPLISKLNSLIANANDAVKSHNAKIDNLSDTKATAIKEFWEIMRWEYDQTLENLVAEKKAAKEKISNLDKEIENLDAKIATQRNVISTKQGETVNVDKAVEEINKGLLDLGIDDFRIVKVAGQSEEGDFYKLVRGEQQENVFKSLSEGEKMIISFLYFLEKCRGKSSPTDTATKKIIVIDDPISSLSHIYVFNVGRMIHREFLRSGNYEQVFVLTHSLYFFYELVNRNDNQRRDTQNLYRLAKYSNGSQIVPLGYSEIQNEYQGYWAVIKDDKLHPVLIANCMRNIIEYFFGFVEKTDLNNVFQKPELSAAKFDAFNRYISRESHSEAVNILDTKEFNYDDFREGFRLVFELCGYSDHYKRMSR